MKKLIFISHGLNVGGAEKFLISLSGLLTDDFNVSIVAISPGRELLHELSEHVEFRQIERRKKIDLQTIVSLRRILLENSKSVICTMDFFCYFYYRLALLGTRKKHRVFISYHSTLLKNYKEYILMNLLTKLLRKKDLVLTVSYNQAAYTSKYFKIDMEQFITIHNGIKTDNWKVDNPKELKQLTCEKYSIPIDAKIITITANLRKEKNHLMAINALKYLHDEHKIKAYLFLVGGGDMLEEIKKEVSNLQLENFVLFTGIQLEVKPYYYSSSIFSLTSDRIETFSIAALEAMACGLPCVLTNIGGANEMIVEGINGYLCAVDPRSIGDAWFKALNSNFSSKTIVRLVEEKFEHSVMGKKYLKVFTQSC